KLDATAIEKCERSTQHCCVGSKLISLDDVDHRLLEALQADADRTLRDLGDLVGLSPSAVLRRVEGYKASGLLKRQVAVLDTSQVPDLVLAVFLVTVERESPDHRKEFCDRLERTPQVQQVYDVSGVWDYVVILAARGLPEVRVLAERLFESDENVRKLTTMFVLAPIQPGCAVPTRPADSCLLDLLSWRREPVASGCDRSRSPCESHRAGRPPRGGRTSRGDRVPGRRRRRHGCVPGYPHASAVAVRRRAGGWEDVAGGRAGGGARAAADQVAVPRGHRRGAGALRVGLPTSTAAPARTGSSIGWCA